MRNQIIYYSDCAAIILNTKTEKVYECLVDVEDVQRLLKLGSSWIAKVDRYGKVYASGTLPRNGQKQKRILMHRWIKGNPEGLIDHINQNTLDNRKSNLRVVNYVQNSQNRSKSSRNNKSSGFLNVSWDKGSQKWKVQIRSKGKFVFYKLFEELEDAKLAAENARIELLEYAAGKVKVGVER